MKGPSFLRMSTSHPDPTLRFLFGTAAAGVLLVVLSTLSPILVPFLQAAFLIAILSRPVAWLNRRRLGQLPSVLLVVTGVALGISVLAGFIGTSVVEIARTAPAYAQQLDGDSNELYLRDIPVAEYPPGPVI